jgi:hypothetical protein
MILSNAVFNEISVAVTDSESDQVKIGEAGFESTKMISFSTIEIAIQDLRNAADWLEKQKLAAREGNE